MPVPETGSWVMGCQLSGKLPPRMWLLSLTKGCRLSETQEQSQQPQKCPAREDWATVLAGS